MPHKKNSGEIEYFKDSSRSQTENFEDIFEVFKILIPFLIQDNLGIPIPLSVLEYPWILNSLGSPPSPGDFRRDGLFCSFMGFFYPWNTLILRETLRSSKNLLEERMSWFIFKLSSRTGAWTISGFPDSSLPGGVIKKDSLHCNY